jgi:hypothetical protein
VIIMRILKKILISSAVSLFVGAANTIGVKATSMIWDRATSEKTNKKNSKTHSQEEEA